MKSWPTKKLGELEDEGVIQLGRGKVISRIDIAKNPGDYPIYSSARLNRGEFGRYGSYMFDEELITWSVDGGGNFFYRSKHKYSVTNVCGWLRILKPDILNYKFLYFVLAYAHSQLRFDYIYKAHPSVIRGIYEIPLPSLAEQKRIVAKIEKLFAKIDEAQRLRAESLSASSALLPSVMHQVFSRAEQENWPTKKLGEVIELNYGKGIPRRERKSNGKYPIYGANGELGRTDKFFVEGEAIIIGRKGSAGEITRVSGKFWPADVTYYVFGNRLIDIDYLFYALKQLDLKQLATGIKPGINRNKVYELQILLPPIAEQKKIVNYLDNLSAKAQRLKMLQTETQNDLLALRQSVLARAFSGSR